VGEIIRQTAFSLLEVVDGAAEVGAAPTTDGNGAGSAKAHFLSAITFEYDVGRMPLIDLAERDLAGLVVRLDTRSMIFCDMDSCPFLPQLGEEQTGASSKSSKERKPGPNRCRASSL